MVLSELHVGAATAEGTYAALSAKFGHFAETGITALELIGLSAGALLVS